MRMNADRCVAGSGVSHPNMSSDCVPAQAPGSGIALQRGLSLLREQHPQLEIAGHHGYFDKQTESPENLAVIQVINEFKPNLLFVGMGMPTQEIWILDNFEALDTNVVLHCGALINYLAGAIPTPPRWLGPIGLEWAFRLATEPRRLWRRYLLEPIALLLSLWKNRKL